MPNFPDFGNIQGQARPQPPRGATMTQSRYVPIPGQRPTAGPLAAALQVAPQQTFEEMLLGWDPTPPPRSLASYRPTGEDAARISKMIEEAPEYDLMAGQRPSMVPQPDQPGTYGPFGLKRSPHSQAGVSQLGMPGPPSLPGLGGLPSLQKLEIKSLLQRLGQATTSFSGGAAKAGAGIEKVSELADPATKGVRAVVEEAGGRFIGIKEGFPPGKKLVWFTDPVADDPIGSSSYIPLEEFSRNNLMKVLGKMRGYGE